LKPIKETRLDGKHANATPHLGECAYDEEELWSEELDVPNARADDRHIQRGRGGFTAVKSEFAYAPVMVELPLVLECELASMNEENCNVVGRIVNCAVEESALTDGKPDAAKMRPICFDPCQHVYRLMGDVVAKAFSCGKVLKG
jgi:hypothetical protein